MTLTRGGMALICLILFVLVLSIPDNATNFIVLSFFLALLLVNVPYAFLAVRGVSVYRDHQSHVKEGSDIRVNLRVVNRSRGSRILLRFLDRGPGQGRCEPVQVPLLAGRGSETVAYTCQAGKRGIYKFLACRIESSSPFGLVNARRSVRSESDLVVYPLYYELIGAMFPFHKSYSGMTSAPGSRPGEGASFFGLREYREGDPIRKIHWSSSLRARTLMVKEFEEDMHSSVVIMLDTHKLSVVPDGADSNLEVAVRAAASLANHTLVNGHPTTLMYYDESAKCLRSDRAMGDLTPVLDSLARLEASSMKPGDALLAGGASIPRHANLILVLLSADKDAMAELLRIRARGVQIMLVLADGGDAAGRFAANPWLPAMMEMFEYAGINIIVLSKGDDIQAALSQNMRLQRRVRL
ncbi:MAG: hypothetical protein C0404_02470 [Verrucomicrobia bacterium]|nr:hypothetical protein [Verrucomicrobiota bacterium]